MYTKEELLFFMDHIQGLMIIDKTGTLIFMNQQCADYIHADLKTSIGKPVNEVFPPSEMKKFLTAPEEMETEFYVVDGRISWTTRIKLRKENKVVGVVEYDLFQDFVHMEAFTKGYMTKSAELDYYKKEVRKLRNMKYTIDNIVGNSEKIRALKKQIRHVAKTNSSVIITGETGTGKELVAHAIHNLSNRSINNFIQLNSAGLPESLAESELFGYEEGAFTGASKGGKKGKFEMANKGTLFIDEINQMPYNLQPKLLRVLQEQEIDKVGSNKTTPIDVRIIVATNEDLGDLVTTGTFREDLYYRLNVMEIKTPALRDIKEDIPELVDSMICKFNKRFNKNVIEVDPHAMEMLIEYNWPGNIRELNNVIERAMNYAEGHVLNLDHFSFYEENYVFNLDKKEFSTIIEEQNPIEKVKQEAERLLIVKTLQETGGNKTQAAKILKIARPLLHQKIKRLKIEDCL